MNAVIDQFKAGLKQPDFTELARSTTKPTARNLLGLNNLRWRISSSMRPCGCGGS